MLPDPDWKAEDCPGVRARISGGNKDRDDNDDQEVIYLLGFLKKSLTKRRLRVLQRTETLRRNQPSPRKMITMPDGM